MEPRKENSSVTVARSLHPLYPMGPISTAWQVRFGLVTCSRVIAAYAGDDLTARAVAAGMAGSKQGMGGGWACTALLRKLDHNDARYGE